MNKILRHFGRIFLFCLPFILMVAVYGIIDPFMVLYNHKDYNRDFYINKNNDFVATEKYIKNSDSIIYDSFIIGSSTARFFPPTIWKKYLSDANEIFCFDASSEYLVGIWSKLKYIHSHQKINNALLIFDVDATFRKFENDNPIIMKHYIIYPSSRLAFNYKYFLNFVDIGFLIRLVHYKLTDRFYPYMDGYLIKDYYYYDNFTNEYFNVDILAELKRDSINYYNSRKDHFGSRSGKFSEFNEQIKQEHIDMLNDIKNIFNQDNTSFKIIIGPAYNQIALNKEDLKIIQAVFGSQNVFDFSGINKFTEDKSNFYDGFHFKTYVAKEMLDIVYQQDIKIDARIDK